MKPLKQKISVTLDEDVILRMKEISEWEDRPLSQYINLILKQFLEKNKTCEKP